MFKASSVRLLVTWFCLGFLRIFSIPPPPPLPFFSSFFPFLLLLLFFFVCAYSATRVRLRDHVFKKMRLWGDECSILEPPPPPPSLFLFPFFVFIFIFLFFIFSSFLLFLLHLLCLSRIIWLLFVLLVFFKSWKSDLRCSNQSFCARIYNTYFR